MLNQTSDSTTLILSLLFFPTYFQGTLLEFAWGASDPMHIAMLKRFLILLPISAGVLSLWTSILCLLTVIFRTKRSEFVTAFLATWWDLFKSIFSFWGGILKFFLVLATALIQFIKVLLFSLWVILQDFLLIPFRLIRGVADNMITPGIPWIAIGMTLIWAVIESIVFTYVMTPLVIDTLSNLTGNQLSENLIRIPLFFFMFILVLGSYSVLSNWAEALKSKNVPTIIKISLIEFVAMTVEVMFLYREFVESLVPWFAQHSKGFELGIGGILFIAFFFWVGIRGMTWFLFASHGTPTIMAIIQGSGINKSSGSGAKQAQRETFEYTVKLFAQVRKEMDWIQAKGEEVLGAFILPPLQIIAATLNFVTLVITSKHLFELPFKNIREVMNTEGLVKKSKRRKVEA